MVCIYCGNDTQVINSRLQKRNNQIWRRRKCTVCQAVFTSLEGADLTSGLRVEQNGALRPFLTDYLFTEVLFAIQDQKNLYIDAREVTNTVIQQLLKSPSSPIFTPKEISKTT